MYVASSLCNFCHYNAGCNQLRHHMEMIFLLLLSSYFNSYNSHAEYWGFTIMINYQKYVQHSTSHKFVLNHPNVVGLTFINLRTLPLDDDCWVGIGSILSQTSHYWDPHLRALIFYPTDSSPIMCGCTVVHSQTKTLDLPIDLLFFHQPAPTLHTAMFHSDWVEQLKWRDVRETWHNFLQCCTCCETWMLV